MSKLTAEEIKFLKNHRQEINNNNFQKLINDFGNPQRLIEILRSIGIQVPNNLNVTNDVSFQTSKDIDQKRGFESIRFPSVKDIQRLPEDLRIYKTTSSWYYFTCTMDADNPGHLYYVEPRGNIITIDVNMDSGAGYRPILEIPNLKKVYSGLDIGNTISLDIGDMGIIDGRVIKGPQDWVIINDHAVIYNGRLINDQYGPTDMNFKYEGSHAEEVCNQILDNIRKLN